MSRIFYSVLLLCIIQYCPLIGQSSQPINYYYTVRLAENLYQKKDFKKSLEIYEQAFAAAEPQRVDLYNAACCAGLTGNFEKANRYLLKSIDNGYIDVQWLEKDTDFKDFKETESWLGILKKINAKRDSLVQAFGAVKKIPLTDFIPYQQSGKWGYLDKTSKNILVEASFVSVSFAGNCLKVELTKNNFFTIDAVGQLTIHRPTTYPPSPPFSDYYGNPKIDSTEGFIGFRMSNSGKMTHVSGYYDKEEEVFISNDISMDSGMDADLEGVAPARVSRPFKIAEKWHAIVWKDGKARIINETGEIFKKVPADYVELNRIADFEGPENWFYFEDATKNKGFINTLGEMRFYKAFDIYESVAGKLIKIRKGNLNGIIDATTMQLVLEPIPQTIQDIRYTFEDNCTTEWYRISRKRILDFYFWVKDKDGSEYYLDKNKTKYLPKNK